MVAGRVGPQPGAARPPEEEWQARRPTLSAGMNCACCASCNAIRRVLSSLRPSAGVHSRLTQLNRLVKTIGERAKLPFGVHAHMLRLRLCPGQCRPRHAADPGLARPSSNPAHRALYGVKPDAIQGRGALNGPGGNAMVLKYVTKNGVRASRTSVKADRQSCGV
jgi:hypothetical protein